MLRLSTLILEQVLDFYNIKHSVDYVITDNAANMRKAMTLTLQDIQSSSESGDADHWFIDYAGPFFSGDGTKPKHNYAFIAIDSFSRFPACYLLKSMHAKSVCDALLSLWESTGCCSYISSDLGTNLLVN